MPATNKLSCAIPDLVQEIHLLERLLQHFSRAGVCFEPMIDYAKRCRGSIALSDWVKLHTVITGANAITG